MTESQKRIAAAALRVFARYGVKRATMSDVAIEADVARQTLYNAYPNKDAVLRGAIRFYADSMWEKVEAGWSQTADLGEKLDILFEHFIRDTWQLIHSSIDARELEGGYNAAGKQEITVIEEEMTSRLIELLIPYRDGFARFGETPARIANHILVAISGIKYGAATLEQASALAATQKAFVLALACA